MILLSEILREVLCEGGHVFNDMSSIKKEYIKPTVNEFTNELKHIYPKIDFKFNMLGSTGKKDESGDIDLAMSSDKFIAKEGTPLLNDWGINKNEFDTLYEKIRTRAKSSFETQSKLRALLELIAIGIEKRSHFINVNTKATSAGSIFCKFPQFDEKGNKINNKFVQIDINVGNLNWLGFSYYSNPNNYKDNIKGLHRTQLILAMFYVLDKQFIHSIGIKDKLTKKIITSNPQEAIQILNNGFDIELTQNIIDDYFQLSEYIKKHLPKDKLNKILDTYLRILDSTAVDIPLNMQQYWINNQNRLNLKGNFLPNSSKLIQYKK